MGLVGAALCLVVGTLGFSAGQASTTPSRPNIVFVLTDDFSTNLLTKQFMPHLWALEHRGLTFSNYFVADSLCCPSRASIFTGRFPHDTGVYTNGGPTGGYGAFNSHQDEDSTFATDLHAAGYRTAMMGKYLNKYEVKDHPAPGWNNWDVGDWGYPEFHYDLNEDGKDIHYGGPDQKGKDNYLTNVLSGLADNFVSDTTNQHGSQPFFLEVASFAPHAPYTPAPRYAKSFPKVAYPKTAAFDVADTAAPSWLKGRRPLSKKELARIATVYRDRAESVKSVDDLIGFLVARLRSTGVLDEHLLRLQLRQRAAYG